MAKKLGPFDVRKVTEIQKHEEKKGNQLRSVKTK
jgi:hypothetical protein